MFVLSAVVEKDLSFFNRLKYRLPDPEHTIEMLFGEHLVDCVFLLMTGHHPGYFTTDDAYVWFVKSFEEALTSVEARKIEMYLGEQQFKGKP